MESPKPIKRSKELTPFSKEHHEALLFGWKLKQGLQNRTELALLAEFVQWFWKADLQEHFQKEEQVLAIHLPSENELVQQMFKEHQQLEALVHLSTGSAGENVFLELAERLSNHVRFEERQLFPFAEKVISAEHMENIYKELVKTRPHPTKWEKEFWLRKK